MKRISAPLMVNRAQEQRPFPRREEEVVEEDRIRVLEEEEDMVKISQLLPSLKESDRQQGLLHQRRQQPPQYSRLLQAH